MITKIFPAFVVAVSSQLFAREVELNVANTSETFIQAWGVTPSELDWDGRPVLRDPSLTKLLHTDSGITMDRVLVGTGGIYRESVNGINEPLFASVLAPQLKSLRDGNVDGYILTFKVPPSVMRVYRSDESTIDFVRSGLRQERESDFSVYIAKAVHEIEGQKLPMPIGVCFQAQPDIPPAPGYAATDSTGCVYTPEEWFRVAAQVRSALNSAGFQRVDLVGPEAITSGWIERLMDLDRLRIARGQTGLVELLSAFTIGIDSRSRADPKLVSLADSLRDRKMPVWIVCDRGDIQAKTNRQQIVAVFEDVCFSFNILHATAWYWHSGFSWQASGQSLLWGERGRRSPLWDALAMLRHSAPKGWAVHHVTDGDGKSLPNAVAFRANAKQICVFVNGSQDAIAMRVVGFSGAATVGIFDADDVWDVRSRPYSGDSISVPPNSIAFVRTDMSGARGR